jgi:hypothetical protein
MTPPKIPLISPTPSLTPESEAPIFVTTEPKQQVSAGNQANQANEQKDPDTKSNEQGVQKWDSNQISDEFNNVAADFNRPPPPPPPPDQKESNKVKDASPDEGPDRQTAPVSKFVNSDFNRPPPPPPPPPDLKEDFNKAAER